MWFGFQGGLFTLFGRFLDVSVVIGFLVWVPCGLSWVGGFWVCWCFWRCGVGVIVAVVGLDCVFVLVFWGLCYVYDFLVF